MQQRPGLWVGPLRMGKIRRRGAWLGLVGRKFDSIGEAERAEELALEERAGEIADLRFQVSIPLHVLGGPTTGHYVADFTYTTRLGVAVVEDFKGMETPLFRWKKGHFEKEYRMTLTISRAAEGRRGRRR